MLFKNPQENAVSSKNGPNEKEKNKPIIMNREDFISIYQQFVEEKEKQKEEQRRLEGEREEIRSLEREREEKRRLESESKSISSEPTSKKDDPSRKVPQEGEEEICQDNLTPPPKPLPNGVEVKILEYLQFMNSFGYHFSKNDIVEFIEKLNCKVASSCAETGNDSLYGPNNDKYSDFFDRHRGKVAQFSNFEKITAKHVHEYFKRLKLIMETNDLMTSPELIYKVDDVGLALVKNSIGTPHRLLPYDNQYKQPKTSILGSPVTLIGCGNALGTALPPYFLINFKNKYHMLGFADRGPPGTQAKSFDSINKNESLMRTYLKDHFLRYVQMGYKKKGVLLLYNGYSCCLSVDDVEWARKHNIHLFVYPPHHFDISKGPDPFEPFDVGLFSNFQYFAKQESQSFYRQSGERIALHHVSSIAGKAYQSCLAGNRLVDGFKKCGIYPYSPQNYIGVLSVKMQLELQGFFGIQGPAGTH